MLLLKKTFSCRFVSSLLALLKEFSSSKVFQTVRCHLVPYPGHKMQDWLVRLPAQAIWGFKVIHKEEVSKGSVWLSDLSEFLPLCPTFWNKWGAFQLMFLHPIVHYLLTKLGWQQKQHKIPIRFCILSPCAVLLEQKSAVQLLGEQGRRTPQQQCRLLGWFCSDPIKSLHRDQWAAAEGDGNMTGPDWGSYLGVKSISSVLLVFRVTQTPSCPTGFFKHHKKGVLQEFITQTMLYTVFPEL